MSSLLHEIPHDGERYDMTFDTVGKPPKELRDKGLYRQTDYVVRWIIDNGEFRGKRVSQVVQEGEFISIFGEDLSARNDLRKKFRISAKVLVSKEYKVDGEWQLHEPDDGEWEKMQVRYRLVNIDNPQNPSEMQKIFDRHTRDKFRR